eukprot:scaffold23502_cov113-Cylindrotheca_fusiformis.AAC.2
MAKRDRSSSEKKSRKKVKIEKLSEPDERRDVADTEKNNKAEKSKRSNEQIEKRKPKRLSTGSRQIFLRKKLEFAVSLLPGSLRNCEAFVEDSIRGLLLKYVEGLGGILMGYENVRLITDKQSQGRGWILDDFPHIHYVASCDALVFSPSVGSESLNCILTTPILFQLQGIVNECRPSHLGVLALNYFNVVISGDQLRASGYSFDPELQNWTAGTESISTQAKLKFKVEKIHECDGTVSLEGCKPSLSLLVEA